MNSFIRWISNNLCNTKSVHRMRIVQVFTLETQISQAHELLEDHNGLHFTLSCACELIDFSSQTLQSDRGLFVFCQCQASFSSPASETSLLFGNTDEYCISLQRPYKILNDVRHLGVKTVKGGFRRRPELIKQRQPDPLLRSTDLQSYGLFDKCERIQQELTERLLYLMGTVPEENAGHWMLDIGCGHGWSMTIPCFKGFCVTGVDLDLQALSVVQNKACSSYLPSHNAHVVRADVSNGLCFKESTFDVAISVSFLQWLCVPRNSRNILQNFFRSLSFVLKPGGKAGIQFYPRNSNDVSKVILEAQNYFKGAIVSDYPHLDRGRKLFLVLSNSKL